MAPRPDPETTRSQSWNHPPETQAPTACILNHIKVHMPHLGNYVSHVFHGTRYKDVGREMPLIEIMRKTGRYTYK